MCTFQITNINDLVRTEVFSFWGAVFAVAAKAISDALFEKVDQLHPRSDFS